MRSEERKRTTNSGFKEESFVFSLASVVSAHFESGLIPTCMIISLDVTCTGDYILNLGKSSM